MRCIQKYIRYIGIVHYLVLLTSLHCLAHPLGERASSSPDMMRERVETESKELKSNESNVYNGPRPPLADIVFFGLSLSGFTLRFLKRVC